MSIEDLRTFCSTFALAQDGSKAGLKERLLEYYKVKTTSVNGSPKPTPRTRFAVKSPPSNGKEYFASETIDGIDQKSDRQILSIIDQLRKSDQRIRVHRRQNGSLCRGIFNECSGFINRSNRRFDGKNDAVFRQAFR